MLLLVKFKDNLRSKCELYGINIEFVDQSNGISSIKGPCNLSLRDARFL